MFKNFFKKVIMPIAITLSIVSSSLASDENFDGYVVLYTPKDVIYQCFKIKNIEFPTNSRPILEFTTLKDKTIYYNGTYSYSKGTEFPDGSIFNTCKYLED